MRIVWTKQATIGWQETADYIFDSFGEKAFVDFRKRTIEAEQLIAYMPHIGAIEWSNIQESIVYRYITIYRRSKMLYFIDDDTIFIADFWDTRKNK